MYAEGILALTVSSPTYHKQEEVPYLWPLVLEVPGSMHHQDKILLSECTFLGVI